jgi:hypothetical protein
VQNGLGIHPFGKTNDRRHQDQSDKAVNFKANHQDQEQRDACRNYY